MNTNPGLGTIDISLTAISQRLPTLGDTLRSLLAQDYGDLRIFLHLSHEAHLLDEGVVALPGDIAALERESGGRLRVVWCRNSGSYRKLIPYLQAHWGQSRLVATADDDTIYPPDWLSRLAAAHARYGCQIAYRGHQILCDGTGFAPYQDWMRSPLRENPGRMILPTGKDGILYDTATFPVGVLNLADALRLAPTADDLWFRWHLAMQDIPVHVANLDYTRNFADAGQYRSLYVTFNRTGRNDRAILALDHYFRSRFGFAIRDCA